MRKITISTALAAAFFLLPYLAFGSDLIGLHPTSHFGVFSTHSAASPAKGQFTLGGTYENIPNNEFYRFSTTLTYGLTDRIELMGTYADQRGPEDVYLGIKHRIIGTGGQGTSIAYLLTASVPTGNQGISTEGAFGAGIILGKKVGPILGSANIIYTRAGTPEFDDGLSISAGFLFSAGRDFWLVGELLGRSSHFSTSVDQVELRLGYKFMLGSDVMTTIGFGADIWQNTPRYRIISSLSLLLPRSVKTIEKLYEKEG